MEVRVGRGNGTTMQWEPLVAGGGRGRAMSGVG
jgi:hypothetical protein